MFDVLGVLWCVLVCLIVELTECFVPLLQLVSIATGVMYATTWNTSLTMDKGVTQDSKEADNIATAVLIGVPMSIWLVVSCILGKRYQAMKIEKKLIRESMVAERNRLSSLMGLSEDAVEGGVTEGTKDAKEVEKEVVGAQDSQDATGGNVGVLRTGSSNSKQDTGSKEWVANEACGTKSA